MVLLKQHYNGRRIIADVDFTFHYGLIKTKKQKKREEEKMNFTFHYGLIKTHLL